MGKSDEKKTKKREEKSTGESKHKHKKPSDKKPSDKKPSDKKPSDKKPSDKKPSDKMSSDKKPSAGDVQRHGFTTNTLDHCETPFVAYQHIQAVLLELSGKKIWDPYYCDGSTKRHLESMGFEDVIHRNEDFYNIIKTKMIPQHDVFLTNPPYSDDHIERLLTFLTTQDYSKPFCLLMPNWVARKKEFKSLLTKNVFYLSPVEPYTYAMPDFAIRPEHVGTDGKTTPYLSSWYIHAGSMHGTEALLNKLSGRSSKQWVVAKTIKGLKWKIQKLKHY